MLQGKTVTRTLTEKREPFERTNDVKSPGGLYPIPVFKTDPVFTVFDKISPIGF
jgi:hypothetical protein